MEKPYSLPKIDNHLMSDEVYQVLKERIFRREFEPGQRLDLNAMQDELGVSRSPLKQALQRLMLEGLVEIKPQSGTFITAPTKEEISELMGVRHALEVYAVGVTAEKITVSEMEQLRQIIIEMEHIQERNDMEGDFPRLLELDKKLHELIVIFARNSYLYSMWQQVNARYRATADRFRGIRSTLYGVINEHIVIVEAICNHDRQLAERCMAAHMESAMQLTLSEEEGVFHLTT